MSEDTKATIEIIDHYWQKGGFYKEIPVEVINTITNELEEKDKEIERLNNIIEEYKNANEHHQKIIHELETMKQPNQLHSENVKLRAENNRLNNIIKELEKYINETKLEEFENAYGRRYGKTFTQAEVIICNMILNKLQELKGENNDKENN